MGRGQAQDGSIRIRPAKAEDENFIFSSWLKSFKRSYYAGPIPMSQYYPVYQGVLDYLFQRVGVQTLVAYNPQEEDQYSIYGYIVTEQGEPPIVHYVYVKEPFRRLKVATLLLKEAGIERGDRFHYTFKTPITIRIDWPGAIFNPLRSRYPKEGDLQEPHQARAG